MDRRRVRARLHVARRRRARGRQGRARARARARRARSKGACVDAERQADRGRVRARADRGGEPDRVFGRRRSGSAAPILRPQRRAAAADLPLVGRSAADPARRARRDGRPDPAAAAARRADRAAGRRRRSESGRTSSASRRRCADGTVARVDLDDRQRRPLPHPRHREGQGHRARASRPGFAEARSREVAIGTGEVVDRRRHRARRRHVRRRQRHRSARRARGRRRGRRATRRRRTGRELHRRRRRISHRPGQRQARAARRRRTAMSTHGVALELARRPARAAEHREDVVLEVADATLAGSVVDTTGIAGRRRAPRGRRRARAKAAARPRERRHVLDRDVAARPVARARRSLAYPTQELEAAAIGDRRTHAARARRSAARSKACCSTRARGDPLASTTFTAAGPGGATTRDRDRERPACGSSGRCGRALARHGRAARLHDARRASSTCPPRARPPAPASATSGIELARGALIGGTVRDGRGQRVPGAHVVIRAGTAEVAGDADAQGEFRIHDAPTGDVDVSRRKGDAARLDARDGAAGRRSARARDRDPVNSSVIENADQFRVLEHDALRIVSVDHHVDEVAGRQARLLGRHDDVHRDHVRRWFGLDLDVGDDQRIPVDARRRRLDDEDTRDRGGAAPFDSSTLGDPALTNSSLRALGTANPDGAGAGARCR